MIKVLIIVASKSIAFAMMLVQHGSDSIKPKPIGIILLQPEPDIGKKEAKDLVFGVVKDSAVPEWVIALLSPMEVLIVSAIPHVNAFQHVLGRMGMHQINDNLDSHSMRLIDELLELNWRAEPG
jgi:hypothetical protein